MRAGAEGEAGVDPEWDRARRRRALVVRGVHPEWPDGEGLERALVLGHPVGIGQLFPIPCDIERRSVAFAIDLDAPRSVARDLSAGDDETLLGQVLQGLLARRAFRCRNDLRGLPTAQAASM